MLVEEEQTATRIAPFRPGTLPDSLRYSAPRYPTGRITIRYGEDEGLVWYYSNGKPSLPPHDEPISTFQTSPSTVLK